MESSQALYIGLGNVRNYQKTMRPMANF